ncbi:hypothetical protein KR093_009391 [Drosophila rubida]|uniref:Bromo domain-containing protein n=1 Tax=Drosophila rubida TaxID=30044 RepID=A0AAD4JRF2_9MUSC|nr:hypothetical protein KR093_009391 [Drosophila rubida]
MKYCEFVLETILSEKFDELTWVFKDPIDAERLGLHDYHNIVKKPMDLSTVSKRLDRKYYRHPIHFVSDMRRIFYNAYLYTTPDHLCYVMAQKLQDVFEDLLILLELYYGAEQEGIQQYAEVGGKEEYEGVGEDDGEQEQNYVHNVNSNNKHFNHYEYYDKKDERDEDYQDDEGEDGNKVPTTLEEDLDLQVRMQQLEAVPLLNVMHMIFQMEDLHFERPITELEFDVSCLKLQTKRSIIAYLDGLGMTGKRASRMKK